MTLSHIVLAIIVGCFLAGVVMISIRGKDQIVFRKRSGLDKDIDETQIKMRK